MRLTIENFKSIQKLENFELKPLNLMAGINSSGKTSLTQCILLLKQTLTDDYSGMLNYKGEVVKAASPVDLVYGKKSTDKFHIGLELSRKDLEDSKTLKIVDEFGYDVYSLHIDVFFHINSEVTLNRLEASLKGRDSEIVNGLSVRRISRGVYKGYYRLQDYSEKGLLNFNAKDAFKLEFRNFFPIFADKINKGLFGSASSLILMKVFREALVRFFDHFVYIGPLRVAPAPIMSLSSINFQTVGIDGAYTRFVLHQLKNKKIDESHTLAAATKEWICDRFNLADDIRVERDATNSYRVKIVNDGLEVELYQVGFGISQVLPIVVQGLLMERGDYFFVDSPEVHMHPSVQSALVDFFIYLSREKGVNVLIETHSEHIITRLRRRIAEKQIDPTDVNLCFVTLSKQGSEYQMLSINDKGSFYGNLPKGFMDTQDEDFRKIIEARYQGDKNE